MALGLREGVAAAALYEVITHSAGNSWMFENRMAHVLAGDYTPLSAVDIFVKDLGLVLDTARASKFPLPLASTAHQMFMQASTAGFAQGGRQRGDQDLPGHHAADGRSEERQGRLLKLPERIQFDLTTVRLFIATAETGSITRAAERIHLAPAAASRAHEGTRAAVRPAPVPAPAARHWR